MAEERFFDDDKDRKYRIRKNEKGEEELVIIDDDEEDEEPIFGVVTDDEEELTEEQLTQRSIERREAAQRKAEALKSDARRQMEEGDYESAQYSLTQASELTEYDGELYYLKLKAFSRGMTSFLDLQKCVDAAEGVREYSEKGQKEELLSLSEPLKERISQFEENKRALSEENEKGKAERRETFVNGKKRSFFIFLGSSLPFIALFVLAMYFVQMMDEDDIFVILTIAFSILSAIAFFIAAFAFYKFLSANKKVRLNEMDEATKIGREYLSCSEELEKLKKIYSSFQNDIS